MSSVSTESLKELRKAAAKQIIVALDGMNRFEMGWVCEALQGTGAIFKVNTHLRERGYNEINYLSRFGSVFADLKLHDIPNTVKNDAKALVTLRDNPPFFVTLMAAGGVEMRRV